MRGALSDITKAVGNTHIVKLNRVTEGLESSIYVKCEYLNPGGSHKDRVALNMIREAEATGLKAGGTIVEATSGNTGAALAMVAAIKGYKCVFVMPDKMSQEKISTLRAFGAKVVVRPVRSWVVGQEFAAPVQAGRPGALWLAMNLESR